MPRFLRTLGLTILAAAMFLLIAGEAGVVEQRFVDLLFVRGLQAGGIAFLVGVALSLLAPFARMVRRGHCVRCGKSIERGQTYCHDHLKNAVQEYQDHVRDHLGPSNPRR
jgi:membrane protein implicated in regulation of membrane protease activity